MLRCPNGYHKSPSGDCEKYSPYNLSEFANENWADCSSNTQFDTGAVTKQNPTADNSDLDCSDFDEKNFKVQPGDPYNLDRDGDGIACDGYSNFVSSLQK
jgi:hypothetical protein